MTMMRTKLLLGWINTQLLIEESFDVVTCFLRCHLTSNHFTRFPNLVLSITWFNSWIAPALILSEQFAKTKTQRKLFSKCSGSDIHSVANSENKTQSCLPPNAETHTSTLLQTPTQETCFKLQRLLLFNKSSNTLLR